MASITPPLWLDASGLPDAGLLDLWPGSLGHAVPRRRTFGKEGECIPGSRTILLASQLQRDPERLRQVLLHEMCHIGPLGHDRRFQAKLSRLAAAGEAWAEKERAQFQQRPRGLSLAAEIAGLIDDGTLEIPEVRWSARVLRMLADRIGRHPRDILWSAPRAPRRWERSRLEVMRTHELQRRLREQMPIHGAPSDIVGSTRAGSPITRSTL